MPDPRRPPHVAWRPPGCDSIVLVLQGGGALGAYQGGVDQALHEYGLEPDCVNGVSIDGINSALIAGNPPERRLERRREFWETITACPVWPVVHDGDDMRRVHNRWSTGLTMTLGQEGFSKPNFPLAWLLPRGTKGATSIYDTAPLRETLLGLVDFDLLNSGQTRIAVGARNVGTGNFNFFDRTEGKLFSERVMASGALPPGLPMVEGGTDYHRDGSLVSNTPLQHVFQSAGRRTCLSSR